MRHHRIELELAVQRTLEEGGGRNVGEPCLQLVGFQPPGLVTAHDLRIARET
jgi:hypothetical protein